MYNSDSAKKIVRHLTIFEIRRRKFPIPTEMTRKYHGFFVEHWESRQFNFLLTSVYANWGLFWHKQKKNWVHCCQAFLAPIKKKIFLAPINHWNYSQEMSWCLSVTTQRDHVVFLWTPTKVSWAVALTISWSAHFLVRVCAFHLPLPRPAKEKWLLSKLSVSGKAQGNNDSDFSFAGVTKLGCACC